jgi:hypothetical protein
LTEKQGLDAHHGLDPAGTDDGLAAIGRLQMRSVILASVTLGWWSTMLGACATANLAALFERPPAAPRSTTGRG